jgi:uncharacterized protein YciI
MPVWSEYKEIAKSRGALAYEVFIIESSPCSTPEELQRVLPSHLAYQKEMEANGSLMLAGPVSDDTGEMMFGGGMIIYRAESMDAAKALADADPMHSEGARSYTIKKWLINEGSFNIGLSLSTQSMKL